MSNEKHKHLTLEERTEIQQCLDHGMTYKAIAHRIVFFMVAYLLCVSVCSLALPDCIVHHRSHIVKGFCEEYVHNHSQE